MTVELVNRDVVRTVDSIPLLGRPYPVEGRAAREDAYAIHVTTLLADTAELLIELIRGAKVAIVTDTNVMDLYGPTLVRALERVAIRPEVAVIAPGERHKTLSQACELLDWLTGTQIGRRDVIVTLGGGVVIDMADVNRRDLELVAARTGQSAQEGLREQLEREVPARRLGTPEEVAGAFAYLAGAAYVSGAVLRVDGGLLSG